jgi:hypothetical protein
MLPNSLPVVGPNSFRPPHAGVEQDELVAGVDDECVLLQHHILERQEVVGELLSHFRLRQADEIVLGLAERQRAIGDDGPLEIAELKAIEVRRLRIPHRRLCKCCLRWKRVQQARCRHRRCSREQPAT